MKNKQKQNLPVEERGEIEDVQLAGAVLQVRNKHFGVLVCAAG